MSLNMNNGRVRFFSKLNALIHELISVEDNFYPETIKDDNGPAAMRKLFVQRKRNQKLHQLKKGTV